MHPRLARLITSTRWPTICGVLIVIGVTVRIGAAFVLMPAEPELNEYGVIAQNLVDGRGYSYFASSGDVVQPGSSGTPIPGSFMGPGYTYTVALARWIGDGSSARFRLALGALNLALSLALLSLVYAAGRQLAGHRAGLTAGALAAVYPQLALVPSLGSAANFYLPATVVVAIGAVALRKQRTGLGIGLLVAGGLWLWTARAEAPLFVIAAVAAAAIGSAAWRRVVGLGLAALAVTAVAMSLLWLLPRTREMDRQLVSATTTGAYNFWLGNASGASGSQKRPPPQLAALEEQASHLPATPDYEFRHDEAYRRAASADIRAEPSRWVALLAKKAVMSVTFDPYDGRTQLPVVAASTVVLLLLALTVLVWGNGFQSLNGIAWPYLALAGAQLLISTLFFALNRYKLNVDVPLLILSGAGIVASFNRPEPEELEAAPTPVG